MTEPTPLTYGDYTVGWICAIATEYVAACAVLDEEHELMPSPEGDNNAYTFGRIGTRNVVIACLPKGRYGTSSAATVAESLRRSFPSTQIRMMVGIAGGAPRGERDIRLGDVVVGCPAHTRGGVVPYTHGKLIQGRVFVKTGTLNSPPVDLLAALQRVDGRIQRKGSRVRETVSKMIEDNPRLRDGYAFPGRDKDRLYQSDYVHQSGKNGCEHSCGSSYLITRTADKRDEDGPFVHYGLIASADVLMKDAAVRDFIAEREDVLCFEMEAAGLDNFQGVVIRGICDYSDSHKNDKWQGYAAATAAAFAKEFLLSLPPTRTTTSTGMLG